MSDETETSPAFKPMAERFRGYLPVVVDVETGGFDWNRHALLEIAAVPIELDEDGRFVPGEVASALARDTLVSLYERFYRPERATLLMVGDFDVATAHATRPPRAGQRDAHHAPRATESARAMFGCCSPMTSSASA